MVTDTLTNKFLPPLIMLCASLRISESELMLNLLKSISWLTVLSSVINELTGSELQQPVLLFVVLCQLGV